MYSRNQILKTSVLIGVTALIEEKIVHGLLTAVDENNDAEASVHLDRYMKFQNESLAQVKEILEGNENGKEKSN